MKRLVFISGLVMILLVSLINFKVYYSYNQEKNKIEIADLKAFAADNYVLVDYSWGCRCEPLEKSSCDVHAQCKCSWGNCECCEQQQ